MSVTCIPFPANLQILTDKINNANLLLQFFLCQSTSILISTCIFNPLNPGAFCEKAVSWTFWWFLGSISVKLPLIWSKPLLHHDSLAFLPLASRFETF